MYTDFSKFFGKIFQTFKFTNIFHKYERIYLAYFYRSRPARFPLNVSIIKKPKTGNLPLYYLPLIYQTLLVPPSCPTQSN